MKRYIRSSIGNAIHRINKDSYYRAIHYLNGFESNKNYFNQWYFSEDDKDKLYMGKVVEKDGNTFYIEISNESNHIEKPYEVLDRDTFYDIAF